MYTRIDFLYYHERIGIVFPDHHKDNMFGFLDNREGITVEFLGVREDISFWFRFVVWKPYLLKNYPEKVHQKIQKIYGRILVAHSVRKL
jgi:hypothetical protein